MGSTKVTREELIQQVRRATVELALGRERITENPAQQLMAIKLVYGAGSGFYRGICFYDSWENGHGPTDFVEIAATGEESAVQLIGTIIHELGHVLAGMAAGHGKGWKHAAELLGLRMPKAAGHHYLWAGLDPIMRSRFFSIVVELDDGNPTFQRGHAPIRIQKPRGCPMGVGTRGGRSRGVGSGSRLRLWVCDCDIPVRVRIASDDFQATCKRCGQDYHRV